MKSILKFLSLVIHCGAQGSVFRQVPSETVVGCLVPHLRRKAFSFSLLNVLAVGLIMLKTFPSVPN